MILWNNKNENKIKNVWSIFSSRVFIDFHSFFYILPFSLQNESLKGYLNWIATVEIILKKKLLLFNWNRFDATYQITNLRNLYKKEQI